MAAGLPAGSPVPVCERNCSCHLSPGCERGCSSHLSLCVNGKVTKDLCLLCRCWREFVKDFTLKVEMWYQTIFLLYWVCMGWVGDVITVWAAGLPRVMLRLLGIFPSYIPLWDNIDALWMTLLHDKMHFVCDKLDVVVYLPIVIKFSIF